MELIHPIFKWLHVIAGVLWIGLLYFFNWINGHVAATMDGDTKKKVMPELMRRTLYFFRWGAAWTWLTGVVLLLVVYYHGGLTFDDPETGFETSALVMIAVTFLGVLLYDALYKSGLASNVRVVTIISFVLIGVVVYLMKEWQVSAIVHLTYILVYCLVPIWLLMSGLGYGRLNSRLLQLLKMEKRRMVLK